MRGGFRERPSGNVLSQAEFERGNAETEASETNHREGLTIDPEADLRAGPVGSCDLGTAADQQISKTYAFTGIALALPVRRWFEEILRVSLLILCRSRSTPSLT